MGMPSSDQAHTLLTPPPVSHRRLDGPLVDAETSAMLVVDAKSQAAATLVVEL